MGDHRYRFNRLNAEPGESAIQKGDEMRAVMTSGYRRTSDTTAKEPRTSAETEIDMNNPNGSVKAEVTKAVRENPDLTQAEIGELFGVPSHRVGKWARDEGIFRNRKRSQPNGEDRVLEDRIRKAEQQLAELRRQKALTEIKFERDGSKVAVLGLGPQPLVAEHKNWLRFLRKNGSAMLREFIETQFGRAIGNGNGTVRRELEVTK